MGAVLEALWKSTPYNETAEGSPMLSMVADGSRLQRTFKVYWQDDIVGSAVDGTAQQDFIGYAHVETHATGKRYIARETPFVFPHIRNQAGNPYLYCVACPGMRGVSPLGADAAKVQTYVHALLDLEFRSLQYRILE